MKRSLQLVLCFIAGLIAFPILVSFYLALGKPPVAVADDAFPYEARIVQIPLEARIHREMPQSSPIPASAENLIAGAGIYQDKCSVCHGSVNETSAYASTMFPRPPQLWHKHGKNGIVGVSDDPVGETYWKVKNGIRLSGMSAYGKALSEKQLWQVSLLLSMANKPLPPEAADDVAR